MGNGKVCITMNEHLYGEAGGLLKCLLTSAFLEVLHAATGNKKKYIMRAWIMGNGKYCFYLSYSSIWDPEYLYAEAGGLLKCLLTSAFLEVLHAATGN